jgi:hypothetical protein
VPHGRNDHARGRSRIVTAVAVGALIVLGALANSATPDPSPYGF